MFTTFLLNKLSEIEKVRSAYKTEKEFTDHILSGEVTIPVTDAIHYQESYERQKLANNKLPSRFQPEEWVNFGIYPNHTPAKVIAIKFCCAAVKTGNLIKYDLELHPHSGYSFRVYNVDSDFVFDEKVGVPPPVDDIKA